MRHLDWDGYVNCRDLGGLRTPTGYTAPGRVARGPRRELLTAAGWSAAREWGLRTVVDLRCAHEAGHRQGDPLVVVAEAEATTVISAPTEDHGNPEFRRTCFPILDSPEYWPHNLRILPVLVRRALEAIATAEPGILIHCSSGRDRTGMITALLLANAGVDPEAIADDYAESVRIMAGVQTNSPTADRQSNWDSRQLTGWLEQTRPLVVAFAAGLDQHLLQLNLDEAARRRLRALLLPLS